MRGRRVGIGQGHGRVEGAVRLDLDIPVDVGIERWRRWTLGNDQRLVHRLIIGAVHRRVAREAGGGDDHTDIGIRGLGKGHGEGVRMRAVVLAKGAAAGDAHDREIRRVEDRRGRVRARYRWSRRGWPS